MSDLLRRSPEDAAQLYIRLGEQVKSYHRHYRMGENTSVSAETARELLASMRYTLELTGGGTLEDGQKILEARLNAAKEQHRLVHLTAPDWQSEYRWQTISDLGRFLQCYDHLHFAHAVPSLLDYPLLVAIPDHLQGMEYVSFVLRCLWYENQLLDALGDAARGAWEARIPAYWDAPLNLCEQPLIQLLGRFLPGLDLGASELTNAERAALLPLLNDCSAAALRAQLAALCEALGIADANVIAYACTLADSLAPRLSAARNANDLTYIFY